MDEISLPKQSQNLNDLGSEYQLYQDATAEEDDISGEFDEQDAGEEEYQEE